MSDKQIALEEVLITRLLNLFPNQDEMDLVKRVYLFAEKHHGDTLRKDGTRYITHPIEVALIIAEDFKFPDPDLVSVAILHDLIEDTEVTKAMIEMEFSDKIATLVEGLTKLDKMTFTKKSLVSEANSTKLIRAVSNDLQVMVVKLADRMNNLKTLHVFSEEKRKRIAGESLEFFALFAKRLGIFRAYTDITDLSLLYFFGERLEDLNAKINTRLQEEKPALSNLLFATQQLFREQSFEARLNVLEKGTHSFYDFEKERLIENVSSERSLYRVVVVVDNKIDAYKAMGLIHSRFDLLRNSIVDMIARPKKNGFQSLFSHIQFQGRIYQFQFRTEEMDEIGQFGLLYYWKTVGQFATPPYFSEFREILGKLSEEQSHDIANSALELIRESEIVVYVDEKSYSLSEGYKIIDLAYEVSPDKGEFCIGGMHDNEKCTIYEPLIDGEHYKLLFDTTKIAIKNDWLIYAKSPKARPLIQKWLSARRKTRGIAVGERILLHYMKRLKIDAERFFESEVLKTYLDLNGINTSELFYRISTGLTGLRELFYYFDDPESYKAIGNGWNGKRLIKNINKYEKFTYVIKDIEDYFIKFSGCCMVLPEAKNTKGIRTTRGIAVHAEKCKNYQSGIERSINIRWDLRKNTYETAFYLALEDKVGALNLLFSSAAKCGLNICNIENIRKEKQLFVTLFFVTEDFKLLIKFMESLEKHSDYLRLAGRSINIVSPTHPGKCLEHSPVDD